MFFNKASLPNVNSWKDGLDNYWSDGIFTHAARIGLLAGTGLRQVADRSVGIDRGISIRPAIGNQKHLVIAAFYATARLVAVGANEAKARCAPGRTAIAARTLRSRRAWRALEPLRTMPGRDRCGGGRNRNQRHENVGQATKLTKSAIPAKKLRDTSRREARCTRRRNRRRC